MLLPLHAGGACSKTRQIACKNQISTENDSDETDSDDLDFDETNFDETDYPAVKCAPGGLVVRVAMDVECATAPRLHKSVYLSTALGNCEC